jgi:primosomal protein N' (replication factor Y)
MTPPFCYRIAVPSPLRRLFDYLPPAGAGAALEPGTRVRVPFGKRELTGLVVATADTSPVPATQLRPITAVLDAEPLLPEALLTLVLWAADYYQYPIGEALAAILPGPLRHGEPLPETGTWHWQLSTHGLGLPDTALARAPRRQQLLTLLRQGPRSAAQIKNAGIPATAIRALADDGLIERRRTHPAATAVPDTLLAETPPTLHSDQAHALATIELHRYRTYLLHGDTGTGKTEVYLRAIAQVLRQGRQALVLVPEIGLTPQTLSRFEQRFHCTIAVLHSGLSGGERTRAWAQARDGSAGIVIGTRSAVFVPLRAPGILIVDEEHDLSFKQQDGFRYSARDVAVMRARSAGIPLVLGSATPSLESFHNTRSGRYRLLRLIGRPGEGTAPDWQLLDLRRGRLNEGIAAPAVQAIGKALADGHQVLVFLNRRGYAVALLCHDCAWIARCPHCETRLTVHMASRRLICHHCEFRQLLPAVCPGCASANLQLLGQGTEKTELILENLFPGTPVMRVDRDSTRRKNALRELFDRLHAGAPCILVGTQMLAKGHHFPGVTLAVILSADDGLMSPDFRGGERMGQLLTQVAGRAGRGDHPGTVIVQSHYCDHPLITTLVQQGYTAFAEQLLEERAATGMPPFRALALLRAEARDPRSAEALLTAARRAGEALGQSVHFLGPLPAPLEKRGGRYRFQLSLNAGNRATLQQLLTPLALVLETLPEARGVRWSIDMDPQEMM